MADYKFIQSNYVSMYPSALRGGTDSTNTKIPINPESRLNSEFNITNPINRLTIDGSFVIGFSNDVLEFSIHGYYFKINGVKNVFNDFSNGNIFASIKLINLSQDSGSYSLLSLSSWESSTNLDRQKTGSNDFEFTGLDFTSTAKKGTNVFSLHILNKNDTTFTVPEASLLRFDPNHVKIEDEISLHDVIYNDNSKLTVSVDEFKGHLTGNVTGDVDGNSKTATDASYASKIGTKTSHPAIGSNLKPVYIDSNGQIKPIDATKGSYTRMVYFDGGEIKEGAKINIYNRAPIDGQDQGKEGDIWFQYV